MCGSREGTESKTALSNWKDGIPIAETRKTEKRAPLVGVVERRLKLRSECINLGVSTRHLCFFFLIHINKGGCISFFGKKKPEKLHIKVFFLKMSF